MFNIYDKLLIFNWSFHEVSQEDLWRTNKITEMWHQHLEPFQKNNVCDNTVYDTCLSRSVVRTNFLSEWKQTNTGSNTQITKFFRTPFLKLICQSALKLNFFMILKINLLLIKFSLVSEKDNTESCGCHSNGRYKRDSWKMAVQYTVW